MARKREERKAKVSSARKRAMAHDQGSNRTYLSLPEGMCQFQIKKEGVYRFDIVPYEVKVTSRFADAGELHYERTFYVHRNVGPSNGAYCCPVATFGRKKCPVCEEKGRLSAQGEDDLALALKLSERQLFAVWDHSDKEAGIKIWDQSHYLFGKHLDTEMKMADEEEGYDLFHSPDERGLTLKVGAVEKPIGTGGGKCFECSSIKFVPRKGALDDDLLASVPCLDDLLVEVPYDDLKSILLQDDGKESKEEEDEEEKPHKKNGRAAKKVKEEDEDDITVHVAKGDVVTYKGKECEITQIKGGFYYLEDEDGGDYKTDDPAKLTAVPVRKGDEDEEEEDTDDEDVKPRGKKTVKKADDPDEDEDDDWDVEGEGDDEDADSEPDDDEEDDEVSDKKPGKKSDKVEKVPAKKGGVKKDEPKKPGRKPKA